MLCISKYNTCCELCCCIVDLVVGAGFDETVVVLRYAVLVVSTYSILCCAAEHVLYFKCTTRYDLPQTKLMLIFRTADLAPCPCLGECVMAYNLVISLNMW